jgi:hypothetical protein
LSDKGKAVDGIITIGEIPEIRKHLFKAEAALDPLLSHNSKWKDDTITETNSDKIILSE